MAMNRLASTLSAWLWSASDCWAGAEVTSKSSASIAHLELQLKAALTENARLERLLGSTRHSVGNHLALLSAMLGRQARATDDSEIRDVFLTATTRVSTIAEMMRSERVGHHERVNARDLIDRVSKTISDFAADTGVSIEVEVGDFELSAEEALPFVVILDELVVNSLKHAFPGDIGGVIRVRFVEASGGELALTVEDDGIGIIGGAGGPRFGAKIISSMAKTLGATFVEKPKSADPNRPGLRSVVATSRR